MRFGQIAILTAATLSLALASCGQTSSSPPLSNPPPSSPPPSSSDTTAACAQANTDFDAWVTAYADAANADQDALGAWLKYDNGTGTSMPDPSSPQLLAAIRAFTTANKHAHALRKIADQDLATYQADITACDQSSLPADCTGDFGQHPTLIAIAERMTRADDTMDRLSEARQAAYRAGDASGVNAQTKPYNAASHAFRAAATDWNKAKDAHGAAATQCTLTPGPTGSV